MYRGSALYFPIRIDSSAPRGRSFSCRWTAAATRLTHRLTGTALCSASTGSARYPCMWPGVALLCVAVACVRAARQSQNVLHTSHYRDVIMCANAAKGGCTAVCERRYQFPFCTVCLGLFIMSSPRCLVPTTALRPSPMPTLTGAFIVRSTAVLCADRARDGP
jgi:hypothetical protein